jgi:hypothetical protein
LPVVASGRHLRGGVPQCQAKARPGATGQARPRGRGEMVPQGARGHAEGMPAGLAAPPSERYTSGARGAGESRP